MSKPYQKYDEEFKKNIVELHKNGKSQTQFHNEYGVSHSALTRWIRQYSGVKMDDNTIMTAKQIRQLQKEKAALADGCEFCFTKFYAPALFGYGFA